MHVQNHACSIISYYRSSPSLSLTPYSSKAVDSPIATNINGGPVKRINYYLTSPLIVLVTVPDALK